MQKITCKNVADMAQFARKFLVGLSPRADTATIIGLYGDLGSGKTTFVQQVAKALGISGSVQSPTFVIVKSYKLKVESFGTLVHIDAYRLESSDELERLGWRDLVADPNHLIFIEWPERVSAALPPDHSKLRFRFVNETTREIALE